MSPVTNDTFYVENGGIIRTTIRPLIKHAPSELTLAYIGAVSHSP